MQAILDDVDLVSAIHDGPFEEPMWQTFLERIRQRLRADYAGITFRSPDFAKSRAVSVYSGSARIAQLLQGAAEHPSVGSPFDQIRYGDLRAERVYTLAELLDPFVPGHTVHEGPVYQPDRLAAMLVMRVTEPGGLSAWVQILRTNPEFAPADAALLSKIGPHLRRSLRSYAEIERHKTSGRIAADVLARLNFGWIALDVQGRIVEESPEAAELLRHGSGLRRARSGHLVASDPAVDRQLSDAIRALAKGTKGRARAFAISQDPWVDLLLAQARQEPGTAIPQSAIVAYIHSDNRSLADRHEQLAELFGLQPSEARFALALSRGLSITEAAASLGITVETARSYSKQIYAKMGVRGQADLIRFILTSVLALA